MIFQDPMSSLNPVFTIGEQIAEPIRIHQKAGRKKPASGRWNSCARSGITDPERRVDEYPHQLSGGMRQRVMIAMALACAPRLLIADEPTTALDVTIQAQIVALLKRLQSEREMAMIFVTHDLKLVEEIADEVAVMYASQIVEQGPVRDVIERPRHPYTRALLECIPVMAEAARASCSPIPGALPNPARPAAGLPLPPALRLRGRRLRAGEPALENGLSGPCDPMHALAGDRAVIGGSQESAVRLWSRSG